MTIIIIPEGKLAYSLEYEFYRLVLGVVILPEPFAE